MTANHKEMKQLSKYQQPKEKLSITMWETDSIIQKTMNLYDAVLHATETTGFAFWLPYFIILKSDYMDSIPTAKIPLWE